MDALVCRRTLLGHRDDVLHLSGVPLTASGGPSPPARRDATPVGDTDGMVAGHDDQPAEPSPGSAHVTAALFASASADGTLLISCMVEMRCEVGVIVSIRCKPKGCMLQRVIAMKV